MKAWMIVGIVLVLLGLILFIAVMSANHWDFKRFGTVAYETNVTEIGEDFGNILVEVDTAQFRLVPSEDGVARVECYEEANAKHSVAVENGTLTVRVKNEKRWHEYLGVNWGTPGITLYLPKAEYNDLKLTGHTGGVMIPKDFRFESIQVSLTTGGITCHASAKEQIKLKTDTGTIRVGEVHTDLLDLAVSTGRIFASSVSCNGDVNIRVSTGYASLKDASCQNLTSRGSTGDLSLKNVMVSGNIEIERSTGDVTFEACDAAALDIETDTGSVTGTLLSEKIFLVETDTGRVSIPKSSSGGLCEIETDTGNIKIEILK